MTDLGSDPDSPQVGRLRVRAARARVTVDGSGAPDFMRYDEVNGRRIRAPADVELTDVPIRRRAEPVDPPQRTP